LLLHLELDEPVVQLSGSELLAELVLGRLARGVGRDLLERARRVRLGPARQQHVEQAILRKLLRPLLHAGRHLRLDHVHRQLGQVSDHRLDVAPDVADLGVLGGFDFQERRLRELGQSPRPRSS
jgi:hypothetical protein